MASAKATAKNSRSEYCVLCSTKHNRTRASFCQCQHCSIPLCFECMKQHHDELLQDVEQISHQYNELRQLVQSKQNTIDEETTKYAADVNRYFDGYIDQLRDTQRKILEEMENAKQKAQDHIQKVEGDLRLIGNRIQGLAKEGSVQTNEMQKVVSDLEQIEQQMNTYQAIRTENPIDTQPDFSIRFDYPSVQSKIIDSTEMKMEVNETPLPEPQKSLPVTGLFSTICSSSVEPKSSVNQLLTVLKKKRKNDEKSSSDEEESDSDCSHIDTSYTVDRMASDGENILYTTYHDDEADKIAYCCPDDDDDEDDNHRHWTHGRIIDMIWWNNIKKFICATKTGIYTVEYAQRKFRINDAIRGKWSYVRVAHSPMGLYAWIQSSKNDFHGIEIYSPEFQSIRRIDFDKYPNERFVSDSLSFSVAGDLLASLYSRMQNNRKILEVAFWNMNTKKSNTVTLDEFNRYTEIRTNGKDRFFITTGQNSFHIISPERLIQTIELENNGRWIAMLDDEQVAVSNGRRDIQLVSYTSNSGRNNLFG